MTNPKDRLKMVRGYLKNISQQKLADDLGVTFTIINSIEGGRQKSMSYDLARAMNKKYPEISIAWLMTGEGDMLLKMENTLKLQEFNVKKTLNNWGQRLEMIPKANNMTGKQFAGIIGVDYEKYLSYSVENAEPDAKVINAIKENVDVSIDWLLYEKGSPNVKLGLED